MVDEKIIEAFHMMWGNFPGTVRLIHKDRTVLAVNEAGQNAGFETGVKCFSSGNPEAHKGCMANDSLASKKGVVQKATEEKIRYWIPVKDCDDVFVHFMILTNTIK